MFMFLAYMAVGCVFSIWLGVDVDAKRYGPAAQKTVLSLAAFALAIMFRVAA